MKQYPVVHSCLVFQFCIFIIFLNSSISSFNGGGGSIGKEREDVIENGVLVYKEWNDFRRKVCIIIKQNAHFLNLFICYFLINFSVFLLSHII